MIDIHTILTMGHIIGVALGLGAASLGDFTFLKSLRRGKLSQGDYNMLKSASEVVWVGLIILIFSGLGFLLQYHIEFPELGLLYNPKLWVKLSIVVIIFLNGLLMHWKNFKIFKSSIDVPFAKSLIAKKSFLIFTTGAISIVSWYSALLLGVWRGLDFYASFLTILGVYLSTIFIAIIIANIFGKYMLKRFSIR